MVLQGSTVLNTAVPLSTYALARLSAVLTLGYGATAVLTLGYGATMESRPPLPLSRFCRGEEREGGRRGEREEGGRRGEREEGGGRRGEREEGGRRGGEREERGGRGGAVSYTHLRAHETEADL
eukprot:132233-Rhodomonas_salina.2